MKKKLSFFLALSLILSLVGCSNSTDTSATTTATTVAATTAAAEKAPDKTDTPIITTAAAKGFGGEVSVTLEILDGVLTDVKIAGPDETPSVGGQAIEKLPGIMLNDNSVDVDGITGATVTSEAILSAARQALKDSGQTLTPMEKAESSAKELEDETTDVLVIGGGGAGLAAAIAATQEGADVILVEKLSFLGGCSAMSGGVITRAAVESDGENAMSSKELYDFLMETSENRADGELVSAYIDASVDTFNWVYDNMVPNPQDASRYPMVPESIVSPRLPGGGGEIMGDMEAFAQKLGIDIRMETSAVELITEDNTVVGAKVQTSGGSQQTIYAKGGVILATGGFASSPEKLAKYSTSGAEQIASYASAGTIGDGLDMAEAVNARISFTDDWDTCGSFSLAFTGYTTSQMHYMMLIDDRGERFVNEANIQPTIYTAMRHQIADGAKGFWFLTDGNIEPDTQWLVDNADAKTAASVEELSDITGISADILTKTIDEYNTSAGTDNDVLGKPAAYNKGLTAPYTVVAASPTRTTTIGGLSISTNAEVYDTAGNIIPGLYAAGEVANSNFYGTIYTCGTAFGHAVVFGRIAGQNAASRAK